MPEDATLAAAGFLFGGALTVVVLNYCAVRATQSSSYLFPFGAFLSGAVVAALSAAGVAWLGMWARPQGASMASWIVLSSVWAVASLVYFIWRANVKPVR